MRISREWLSEYINVDQLNDQELATTLTQLGLEVETIEEVPALPDSLLVGEITSCLPHPEADKLKLCQVAIGENHSLQIVCGAPNARVGLKVAVATVGCQLSETLQIKATKIRDHESFGMLCSEDEMGLIDEKAAGILELDASYQVGQLAEKYLRRKDSIFELSITPNRGDCLSYIGIARDLGAKTKRLVRLPSQNRTEQLYTAKKDLQPLSIKIDEQAACNRFCALAIDDLKITTSPLWLRRRLRTSGMRSINLIVDVANYVMLEMGQPVHTYDRDKLSGKTIYVKSGTIGTKTTTLDGIEREIRPEDILICDQEKVIGLGGVMGGQNSEITPTSKVMVLEVAHFASIQIRRTAKRLALHSEASHRFERGIDCDNIHNVAIRYLNLLASAHKELKLPPPGVLGELIDNYPKPQNEKRIALRIAKVKKTLAMPQMGLSQCRAHLESLGLTTLDSTDERLLLGIPSYRHDLVREIDLVEEIGRLEGYDKIPYELPKMEIRPNSEDPFHDFINKSKIFFAARGLLETITYPFLGSHAFEKLNIGAEHPLFPALSLQNALNEEMSLLQTTLVPGLLQALQRNRHHGVKTSLLFEVGRGYHHHNSKAKPCTNPFIKGQFVHGRQCTHRAKEESRRHFERTLIAGVLDATYQEKSWRGKATETNFFHAKELIQIYLRSFGQKACEFVPLTDDSLPWLQKNRSAMVFYQGEPLGWLGELHPKSALAHKLGADSIALFELDLESVFNATLNKARINPNSQRFPTVSRDFSFEAPKEKAFELVHQAIEKFPSRTHLKHHRLFDLYEGTPLKTGYKSLSISFIFANQDRTLTDAEVDKEASELLLWLKKDQELILR